MLLLSLLLLLLLLQLFLLLLLLVVFYSFFFRCFFVVFVVYVGAVVVFAVVVAVAPAGAVIGAAVRHPVEEDLKIFRPLLTTSLSEGGIVRHLLFERFCCYCCLVRLWGRAISGVRLRRMFHSTTTLHNNDARSVSTRQRVPPKTLLNIVP